MKIFIPYMTYFAIRNPAAIAPPSVGNMFTGFFLPTNDLGGAPLFSLGIESTSNGFGVFVCGTGSSSRIIFGYQFMFR